MTIRAPPQLIHRFYSCHFDEERGEIFQVEL